MDRTARQCSYFAIGVLTLAGLTACSDSATGVEEEEAPQVVQLATGDIGVYDDSEYYIGCYLSAATDPASTCPVIRWAGYEYWFLAYGDNRSSMAIHVYGPAGTLVTVEERTGARYVYAIDIDDVEETITARGQVDRTITMTWDELRDLR